MFYFTRGSKKDLDNFNKFLRDEHTFQCRTKKVNSDTKLVERRFSPDSPSDIADGPNGTLNICTSQTRLDAKTVYTPASLDDLP